MRIAIPDDWAGIVPNLDCFARLAGHDVDVYDDHCTDEAELARRFARADAVVPMRERTAIGAGLVDRLPPHSRLRLVSQTGAVSRHIDVAACTRAGIAVAAGRGGSGATGELTWALILASVRHLVPEANRLRAGGWQRTVGTQLAGRRLGIWSYGRIGAQVARYGRAFDMTVSVWGSDEARARARADGFSTAPSRDALLASSDVVSLHLRLSPRTTGLIGPGDLAQMKPDALLVNTSRAELIAPGALAEALRRGRPGFAAVDVYEQEPPPDGRHPLLALDNALCTPHLGYTERDTFEAYYASAFDNVLAFARGEPASLVNPDALHVAPRPGPADAG